MTRFWRDGYYRTNTYGTTSWVDGHWVERYDWSRYGNTNSHAQFFRSHLHQYRVGDSYSAQFINPNAECPVCGNPVFFYKNKNGSKVFFDELGPPWPKHSCTDLALTPGVAGVSGDLEPRGRSEHEISEIGLWTRLGPINLEDSFTLKYDKKPWTPAEVLKRIKGLPGVMLVLKNLNEKHEKKMLVACKSLPRSLREGSVVMIKNPRLSYFDTNLMEPKEVVFRRIKSLSSFLDELTS